MKLNMSRIIVMLLVTLVSLAYADDLPTNRMSKDQVRNICRNNSLGSLTSAEQLRQFAEALKIFVKDENASLKEWPFMEQCIRQSRLVFELDSLIRETGTRDVCHPVHIDALVAYHYKYLEQSMAKFLFTGFGRANIVTKQFFRNYAQAVSLTCNQNVYVNTEKAFDDLDDSDKKLDFDMLIGELIGLQLDTDIPLPIMYELVEIVQRKERPSELELVADTHRNLDLGVIVEYPLVMQPKIEQRIQQCQKLANYYESSVKSITKLNAIGYGWEFDTISFYDPSHTKQKLGPKSMPQRSRLILHRWLNHVQRCDHLLNVNIQFQKVGVASVTYVKSRAVSGKKAEYDPHKSQEFELNNRDFPANFVDVVSGNVNGAKPVTEMDYKMRKLHGVFKPDTRRDALKFARDHQSRVVESRRIVEEFRNIARSRLNNKLVEIDQDSAQKD